MSKNHVILEGRCARDGEIRGKVGKFSLAVQSWRKDPKAAPDSKFPNLTNWFTVVGFGAHADTVAAVRKGQIVAVEGSVELAEWQDRTTGQTRTAIEVHVGGKDGKIAAWNWNEQRPDGPASPTASSGSPQASARVPASGGTGPLPQPASQASGGEFFDDDVPF
jgi:single stranded DNA-binding protein